MPSKIPFYTEQDLKNASLPTHGGKYAVVPHGDVIDNVKYKLAAAGFNITDQKYRMTTDGQVAQGIYHLSYGTDAQMGMMFAWSNSYNKTMRFKCGVGAYVFVCANGVLRGDIGNYSRKHTGVAYTQVMNEIKEQLSNAQSHYNALVQDRNMLDKIILSPRDKGRILGELFAEDEILTLTQVGIIKREIDKPSHNYNSHVDSAWTMYNHVTLALKESHPTSYMKDHQKLHDWFINKYGSSAIVAPVENEVFGSDYDVDKEEFTVNFL